MIDRNLELDFYFNPNFEPKQFRVGTPDSIQPESIVRERVQKMQSEWDGRLKRSMTRAFRDVLELSSALLEHSTCHLMAGRRKLSESLYLEAYSRPLLVWAAPEDPAWGLLPSFAWVGHELIHRHSDRVPQYVWECYEDQAARMGKKLDPTQLDEQATRLVSFRLNQLCFGKQFAEWFKQREADITLVS